MKIFFFLLFAAQLSAQSVTVFCGTQNQTVTPEVAEKFDLKNSDILTLEDFREVYAAMHPVEVRVEPVVITGEGTHKNPYIAKTPAEMIKEVAEAIREEDPKTAAMLYVILGSLEAKDSREKENLFELLILVAKSRTGQ
jgi:hypothetical protein